MFRRLITLAVAAALFAMLVPAALAVRVHVRVEGKTTTIFGAAEPTLSSGPNALAALEAAHSGRLASTLAAPSCHRHCAAPRHH